MKYESNIEAPFARLGDNDEYEWTSLPWDGVHNEVLHSDRATGTTLEKQGADDLLE